MKGHLNKIEQWEEIARVARFHPGRMADHCGVSLRQLERFFQGRCGLTPSDWLRELQCRLARDLITQGYSTKAATAELGFSSAAHFCREFRKIFGVRCRFRTWVTGLVQDTGNA